MNGTTVQTVRRLLVVRRQISTTSIISNNRTRIFTSFQQQQQQHQQYGQTGAVFTNVLTSRTFASTPQHDNDKNNKNSSTSSALPVTLSHVFGNNGYSHRFKSTSAPLSTSAGTTAAAGSGEDQKQKDQKLEKKIKDAAATNSNKDGLLLDFGIPALIPEWKRMFSPSTLFTDVSAGITVGCIAVPLSLAIAVASGVPAEVGLVTAAVSGIAGGMLGGTTLAVTGPAAAISLLVVTAVQQHGLESLPFITLACGGLQVISGVTRLGVVAKLVPVSVIAGFTTGVGTMILTGQLPKAFGLFAQAGMNPIEVLAYIGENVSAINPSSAALAIGTSAAMFALPKLHPKVPSALLAVGGATLATHMFGLDVALIGSIPSGLEAFQFGVPIIPPMDALPSLTGTVLLIYAMTSVESLLSCAALEKMKKTPYKHSPDQELVGQGLSNMGAAMFMGMPVTSVIARSSLNVRLNAETRLPALVQAGFVFSSVVFMSEQIAKIPMPALSGVLITTGMGMLNPTEFKHCYAVQKSDVLPFLTTIGGMISLGLAEGIGIGCASALAMGVGKAYATNTPSKMLVQSTNFINIVESTPATDEQVEIVGDGSSTSSDADASMASLNTSVFETDAKEGNFEDTNGKLLQTLPETTNVWQLSGPINFISMFEIDNMMKEIKQKKSSDVDGNNIVVDVHGVTSVEFTGVEELCNRLVEVADDNDEICMINCTDSILSALDQCDPKQNITRFTSLSPTTTTTSQ